MDDLKKAAVKRALERLNAARKELCALREADFGVFQALLGLCESLGLKATWPRVSVSRNTRELTLSIKTDTLKSMSITSLLAFCAEYYGGGKSNDYASELYASREFRFGDWESDRVIITFEIASDSATCRRVKVGMEMREVAEYKIVCD